jgi:hypothetical protein
MATFRTVMGRPAVNQELVALIAADVNAKARGKFAGVVSFVLIITSVDHGRTIFALTSVMLFCLELRP